MISDEEFVTQSVTLNLFYLGNIRAYCMRIALSFLSTECKEGAKEFVFRCDEIWNGFINHSYGILSKFTLNSNFIVTEHTLDCERLTEKLFGTNLDLTITEKLLKLKDSPTKKIDSKMVELMTKINKQTYDLATEYVIFLKEVLAKEVNNEWFSFAYPHLIREIINTIELSLYMLERNIKKMVVNPTFVSNYEYRLITIMKNVANFIALMVNPDEEKIYIKASSFSIELDSLKELYLSKSLDPTMQKKLSLKIKKLMKRFTDFISDIITEVLNSKAYFVVEPSFLDVFYRGANYFIYNLTLIESEFMEN